jgi:deoxyhypusine synthase
VDLTEIQGYDFNNGIDYSRLLDSFYMTGFQATNMSLAVKQINQMIEKKEEPLPEAAKDKADLNPVGRPLDN